MLGYFSSIFSSEDVFIISFKIIRNIIRVLKRLDPDQLNNEWCLIWVQTRSLGYQLTTKDVTSIGRV